MKKQLFKLVMVSFCLCSAKVVAQDFHFSQFSMTPTLINPAAAGSENQSRAFLNYRNQWRSISAPYTTVHASTDMALTKNNASKGYLAAGLDVTNDQAGTSKLRHLQATVSLAYHTRIGENSKLGAGLYGGFAQRSVNYNDLRWGSQYDGNTYNAGLPGGGTDGANSIAFADLGAGLIWSYSKGERYMTGNDQQKYTLGFSVLHANRPSYSFFDTGERLNLKTVFHGEALIGIPNSGLSIVPGFMYAGQGSLSQVMVGARFRLLLEQESNYTGFEKGKAIAFGTYYRVGDAFVPSVHLEMGKLEFCMSYDFTVSSLTDANNARGGMEIALRYLFAHPLQKGAAKRY